MLATEVHHDDAEALVVAGTGPVPTKPKLGVYGAGAYKDECWSLQAYQKRVYAIRESYKVFLRGTGIENPGLDDRVCNLLSSIARLVGKQAVHVPDALIPKQVAALVQAADPKNRKLVLSAAMIAKGICDTNRSKQESLLDHKDFRIEVDEKGVMRGVSSKVGVTKTDRLQLGSTQQLRCTEYCDGKGVKFDEKGLFYLSLLCPAHLLLYVQELTVEELGRGVSVEMLGDCPFWADYAWLETLPKYLNTAGTRSWPRAMSHRYTRRRCGSAMRSYRLMRNCSVGVRRLLSCQASTAKSAAIEQAVLFGLSMQSTASLCTRGQTRPRSRCACVSLPCSPSGRLSRQEPKHLLAMR